MFLHDLVWQLDVKGFARWSQVKLLEQVVEGECFTANELPEVPDAARKPPKLKKQKGLFDQVESGAE